MSEKTVGLLSIPYDQNSSYCQGPAKAPEAIKHALLHGSLNKGCENGQLLDFSDNIKILPELIISEEQDFVERIYQQALAYLKQGFPILSLGGDHSVSYPLVKAYHQLYPDLTIVHLDAHSDLYHEFKGTPLSNACPFARIMENQLADRLIQVGIRTLTAHQLAQAEKFNVEIIPMSQWPCQLPEINGPIYVSIDVDAIDPAFAPGVSHPEPGGLSSREVINLLHQLPNNVVGMELVEFNPDKDIAQLTAVLCAKLVKECLGKLLVNKAKL